jgi:hypothetical protein
MKLKLTQKAVAALALPEGKGEEIAWDEDLPRFGLRLRRSASGKLLRSWIVQYTRGDRSPRIKLGDFEVLDAGPARAQARKLLGRVAIGEDPQADRRERRDKDKLLLRSLVDEYLAEKKPEWAERSYIENEGISATGNIGLGCSDCPSTASA